VRAEDVRLPAEAAERLRRRVDELLPLGSLAPAGATDSERRALAELAERLANNYPYHDPRYAGQMLAPPHPVAWAAYATTMLVNPNNHALDGGPATATMEREAVAAVAGMLGHERHLGHLTASGTIANLEGLWVARELAPGTVLYGANAHYTHQRICDLLRVPHESIPECSRGRLDVDALEARLAEGGVGTVVATLGTTALGALDPLEEIADLCSAHGARLHVDAAYGGFFTLIDPEPFAALARADSIVVDPHKHGLQPYGCGCVVFSDPAVARVYEHESPYTYFTSPESHLGEITLECSRAGAAAAALWTTMRALPLTKDGLGRHLSRCREAALALASALRAHESVALVVEPELDIVCCFACRARASDITAATEAAFDALAQNGWHVAKLQLDAEWVRRTHAQIEADEPSVSVLRCCLMKDVHAAVTDELGSALADSLAASLS
jgi:glutamate/tyrosine decarboxylase-like PLP-dependent enzyme